MPELGTPESSAADERSLADTYRAALAEWTAQLDRLHAWRLDGERLDPPQIKGLLNREARAKAAYDAARRRLLGLAEDPTD